MLILFTVCGGEFNLFIPFDLCFCPMNVFGHVIATVLSVTNLGPEFIKLFSCSTHLSMKFQKIRGGGSDSDKLILFFSNSEMLKCQQLVAF